MQFVLRLKKVDVSPTKEPRLISAVSAVAREKDISRSQHAKILGNTDCSASRFGRLSLCDVLKTRALTKEISASVEGQN
jgi:hypothetical protein